jgi:ABC-type multidrug transport system fused ATPase/permease subunit
MLKGGRVVEIGTFDQLIEARGPFYRLVEQQLND